MPARTASPLTVARSRLKWLRKQLSEATEARVAAFERESFTAVSALMREERQLRADADAARLEVASLAAAADDRPMTPEERAATLSKLVESASDDELDVAVREWLRRRRYRMTVLDDGTLTVYPLGEEPSLRLVEGG